MAQYATAYLITEDDVETLAKISPYDEQLLKNNLNWVVVVDYKSHWPKWHVYPRPAFERLYPGIDYSRPVALY